jgi:hypothetical protein
MKTNRIVLKAIAAALATLSVGAAVAASETANVTASITVQGICRFTSGAAALAFGSIDPSAVASDLTMNTAVAYKCTKDLTPSAFTQSGGTSGNLTNGTNTIGFTVNNIATGYTPVAGNGFGAAVTAHTIGTITVTIPQANAQNAPVGTYNNNATPIVLTLTY